MRRYNRETSRTRSVATPHPHLESCMWRSTFTNTEATEMACSTDTHLLRLHIIHSISFFSLQHLLMCFRGSHACHVCSVLLFPAHVFHFCALCNLSCPCLLMVCSSVSKALMLAMCALFCSFLLMCFTFVLYAIYPALACSWFAHQFQRLSCLPCVLCFALSCS